ncbi:DUF3325 domain-containing protein [Gilvimarinus xylanilyticus]|uniref:DUF3325 domain-containing protein n=1 Tax=Gilvimarinus xylanilyticus TaxID=2944139 RepID=A0A9X2KVF5_9GAMM|nr:DUF3325 domain-containing protein [Gilvimarinus xylanilyticus]MCP8900898.1 DUF3325 domain-containing protein [Gilvimarinus xylanilyticus]
MLIIAYILSLIGLTYFAATIKKPFQLLHGKKSKLSDKRKWILHGFGYLHIAFALYPCVHQWGPQVGIAIWVGIIHVAGFSLVPILTYRPNWFCYLWKLCLAGQQVTAATKT